ncbi:hypothetical protein [Deinococcus apachensis]|uniref:hypothetical protein n=1 Tax=Deinococcus apachensis TaxID=309886 RepID=UPI00037E6472|nr:hypothetical protein [Deinococcus apachensis]
MNNTSPVSVTRTWEVALYGNYGDGPSARVYLGKRTVTLSGGRDARGQLLPIVAQVNGCEVSEEEAVSLLNWGKREGRVTLLSEERTVPTIGKCRAHELHRLMGLLGLPGAQHYSLAAAALGEWTPLGSLAELTEQEARTVWQHVCSLYPSARTLAA